MALADRWLLPEGIKELLPPQARQAELMRRRILDLYNSWGYELVMPPLVEHLESLLTGTGRDLDLITFKLTDRQSGHALGIRADITPQVARIDAHRLRTEGASRLCYCGSVIHTHAAHMLASRNPLQAGAELYGHAGIESDAEIIALMLETLHAAGISDVLTLDLGHVGLFRALVREAGLDQEQKDQFIDLLQRKAMPEIAVFIETLPVSETLRKQLSVLPSLHGTVEVLAKARDCFNQPEARQAIDYLAQLAALIQQRYPTVRCYFDLAELRGYHYHTGVVFAAYTPSYGQSLAKGGRYDEIGEDFGRARPATGFSTDLSTLIDLAGVTAEAEKAILAPADVSDSALQDRVRTLRQQGYRVIQMLDGLPVPASCDRRLENQGGEWQIKPL
ncbi:ATP phosphoribosyltransferase regulatory subunit [Nitrincola iocasae]|jgi:ATP phosphoribosyltransferase regulatory subunit|uniref:ATP phosphoribosyltransferase regulatory subunit n=1 Tax=Nitrincola iocasae TaxID=2614693 RepID=A0A5J6LGE6_9GAMM|nr:ATP phosphoribosyltransferase regulatory subunit [Nitrincola iocasae]QEW07625.1 ATP phosphoribosyltransferase regulatory subunit [Nitrincola iocasae]